MKKKAFITGVTGQDGSYLAEFLLSKNYEVHGIKRRSSSFNTDRINHLIEDENNNFFLHYGDLTDTSSLYGLIRKIQPDEIYNLAAQSHVDVSFKMPEYTSDVNAIGTLRLLEAIRKLELTHKTKFYQASTSELYGLVQEIPQRETTPFYPRSPYGVSKIFAYWMTINYRESYNLFACNGILFNHESPRRGETFVTRKITRALSRIAFGLDKCLFLGNLDALRDWGHAKDYVEMQWLMLQQKEPKDFVISTGRQSSIRDFIRICCRYLGLKIEFKGKGVDEVGYVDEINHENEILGIKKGDVIIRVDQKYFRPSEVETLLGDSALAKDSLGWEAKRTLEELANEMMENDMMDAKKDLTLKQAGLLKQ